MKKGQLILSALLVPLDYFVILLAGSTAYFLRFHTFASVRPVLYEMPFDDFIGILLICAFVLLILFAIGGLYGIQSTRRITDEFRKIFFACSTGALLVILLAFFNRNLFSSRFIILTGWALVMLYVGFSRWMVILAERALFSYGIGVHRIVLVGNGSMAQTLLNIFQNPKWGYEIMEKTDHFDSDIERKLEKIMRMKRFDEIVAADPDLSREVRLRILNFCNEHHIIFKYPADLFEAQAKRVEIRVLGGVPIIEIKRTPLDGWGKIFKRGSDILFSLIFLIFFGPLMLLLALLIQITSKGPIMYRNERVGQDGKVFETYKFRTMKKEFCIGKQFSQTQEALAYEQKLIVERSVKKGPIYKIQDDPRLTGFGKFLRRSSLDELPQFLNVLKGEMSLVGPRPHQAREVEKYRREDRRVLTVKPGISGISQISGRSNLEYEEEIRLDTYYIENWSFWLDMYILFKTPFVVLKREGAL